MERADEIYLIDMWRIVAREWRWFAGTAAVVLMATFAYLHASRSQWEATAWIQLGQLGVAPAGQDPKVEPFQRVLERLDTLGFQNDVLKSIGVPVEAPEAKLYRRSLKLEPLPYASLIKLRLRAYSAQDAAELASATVTVLQAIHRRIEARPLELARKRLGEVEASLKDARAEQERLSRETAAGKGDDARMAGVLLAGANADVRTLEQVRNDLMTRLADNYTSGTSMAWPIDVPADRVFPNAPLTLGMGVLAAAFLASLAAVARHALRRRGAATANLA
ncbi:Wzz/FepE/Etk N-terminal domain-containing protein [Luteibacter sp. E-22]|uniref:Wzz/FepE/Etk N-terminal domain-containing protein n=1 Tax=Luteibacter sp. E-22 TaxID=3404050 RepID=UPI003CF926A3